MFNNMASKARKARSQAITSTSPITGVRFTPDIDRRLAHLAKETGRTKSFYVRQAVLDHLDDLEDAYLGAAVLERVRLGKERVFTTEQVRKDLGLDD